MKQQNVTFKHLVAYASGELTGRDASMVEVYLAVLPEAARQARHLQEVIQTLRTDDRVTPTAEAVRRALGLLHVPDAEPGPDWLAPVRVLARLVFDSRSTIALAGYRGSADGYQLAFETDDARVDLQILPRAGEDLDAWRIRGQVTLHDDARLGAVSLMQEPRGTVVASIEPDCLGRFKIDSTSGVYDLRIELDEGTRSIVAPRLQVGPE